MFMLSLFFRDRRRSAWLRFLSLMMEDDPLANVERRVRITKVATDDALYPSSVLGALVRPRRSGVWFFLRRGQAFRKYLEKSFCACPPVRPHQSDSPMESEEI